MTDAPETQPVTRYVLVLKDAVTEIGAEQIKTELLQEQKKPDGAPSELSAGIDAREAERVREERRSQEAAESLRQRTVDPRQVLHAMDADRQLLGRRFNLSSFKAF
jgi:hypothetical protein